MCCCFLCNTFLELLHLLLGVFKELCDCFLKFSNSCSMWSLVNFEVDLKGTLCPLGPCGETSGTSFMMPLPLSPLAVPTRMIGFSSGRISKLCCLQICGSVLLILCSAISVCVNLHDSLRASVLPSCGLTARAPGLLGFHVAAVLLAAQSFSYSQSQLWEVPATSLNWITGLSVLPSLDGGGTDFFFFFLPEPASC